METKATERYRRAHALASAKAADMPAWMLRRCVNHSIRLAGTAPYRETLSMHEAAWGSADGFTDEIVRRRAQLTPGDPEEPPVIPRRL